MTHIDKEGCETLSVEHRLNKTLWFALEQMVKPAVPIRLQNYKQLTRHDHITKLCKLSFSDSSSTLRLQLQPQLH